MHSRDAQENSVRALNNLITATYIRLQIWQRYDIVRSCLVRDLRRVHPRVSVEDDCCGTRRARSRQCYRHGKGDKPGFEKTCHPRRGLQCQQGSDRGCWLHNRKPSELQLRCVQVFPRLVLSGLPRSRHAENRGQLLQFRQANR